MLPNLRLDRILVYRPGFPAALLLVVGIASHRLVPEIPLLWLTVLPLLIVASAILRGRTAVSCSLIAMAILICGVVSAQLAASYFPRNDIGAFASDEPRLAWVEAKILETPRIVEPPPRGRTVPDKQFFHVSVLKVLTRKGWESASGEMPIQVSPPCAELAAGQVVRMLGQIERPLPAMNPGQFDAAARDRRQRILVTMRIPRPYEVQIISSAYVWSAPLTRVRNAARSLLREGFKETQSEDRALLSALVFGDREPALRDIEDHFNNTGTAHLLAANGARVAMLGLIVYTLCRILRLPPRRAVIALTICVALGGLLTMPASQALRPAIVCLALGFAWIQRRTTDSLNLLALAAITVLVLRPLELYGAGFQLSFVIVLGLILLTRPALKMLEELRDEDKRVARSFLPPTVWRTWQAWLWHRLIELTAAAMVSWLVAIPLVAYHFEQFNFWTVPFGILLTPFASVALAAGFVKIALTATMPGLAAPWAAITVIPATVLRHIVAGLARVPMADVPIPSPTFPLIVLFYLLLCLPLIHWARPKLKWLARCAPAGGCAMLLLGAMRPAPLSPSAPALRITLLSVGAGQCAIIEPSGSGALIFDAGSSSMSDPLRTCISPFLRHEGRWSIDSVWLSHGDYDHISAAEQLVPTYGVRRVITSPHFSKHAAASIPCRSLLTSLENRHRSPRFVAQGEKLDLDSTTKIEVLWPPPQGDFKSNDAALVLRLTCHGRSILFPADIQERAERELLKHPELLKSDILIAPHHGSAETTTARFIEAVDPQFILSSNDARLTMKQRLFDSQVSNRPLYRTSRYGAVTIDIEANGSIRILPYHGASLVVVSN